jgi:hypothetical protein
VGTKGADARPNWQEQPPRESLTYLAGRDIARPHCDPVPHATGPAIGSPDRAREITDAATDVRRREPVQGFLARLMLWLAGTAPVVEGYEDGATLAMVE